MNGRTTASPADIGPWRQRRLLSILACPTCHRPVEPIDQVESHQAVVDAELVCARCGDVGAIRTYRPSFHPDALGDGWIPRGLIDVALDPIVDGTATGGWNRVEQGLLGEDIGTRMSGRCVSSGVVFELGTHDWSGRVRLACSDETREVDLYSVEPGSSRITMRAEQGSHDWSIELVGGGSPARHADQVILRGVRRLVPAAMAEPLGWEPANNGNPYPVRFDALVRDAAPEAIILDIGGGDRRYHDPRVMNFEYLTFPYSDVFGNGLALPFADDSVDLVLSQAVLEHVPDPKTAVDEIRRVLKPGGRIYAEFAFMQPLHAVPYHFFNITPHGAALVFSEFDVETTGTFGGLADTLRWMFALVDADRRLGTATVGRILSELAVLDADLSQRELDHIASAVFVEGTKPSA